MTVHFRSDDLQLHYRRGGDVAPASWSESDFTVEAVLTTYADVQRRDHIERLDPAGLDMRGLIGTPILDAHNATSARNVIGIIQSVRSEAGRLIGVLRLAQSDDAAPIVDRIRNGFLRDVSIGFRVHQWAESRTPETGGRIRTAVRWSIFELSVVPIGADPGARIRGLPMDNENEILDRTPIMPDADQARIRSIGELADLPPSFAEGQISGNATIEEVRTAAREAMVQRSAGTRQIRATVVQEAPEARIRAMGDALDARLTGTAPSEAGRQFSGASLRDLATECLHVRGISTRGMNPDALFRAAHTTSDFPQLLQGVGNRTLMAAYTAAASPLKQIGRQGSRPDFRAGTALKLGELSALSKVTESGEIKAVSRSETSESYVLDTYAGMFSITRKALINDDLNAFGDWARVAGQAAAATEAEVLWSLLSQSSGAGPVMGEDSKRLFHADHGNLLSPGAGLTFIELSDARKALRTVKGLDGKTVIQVVPKYLLVGPELETAAEQIVAQITANTVSDVNPFAGKLIPLIEPRITDDSWYLFADPATAPVLEYSYLSSAPGPQMASREGWDVLSTEYRVVLDFGAGAVDWRGAVRNPGL
ncbi:prohead protease/major capsid protein fusion protein [Bosea sp. (in: a-proteobacteria)]|uniref:prohead protease/major capsid protein fusion protein n=1 Tax=Bosea sp. (in: a-proteobacteria) TaxID=1871050 RepID=UPI002732412B|nr:prohead protease/major capsid protein fusion protein [Bosea sp. (in: a-proteobacteria)]MDP3409029.1 Mu-like prophage major head subunit gpT family protein [Bosea sp. (in: a-proteobacteria)]